MIQAFAALTHLKESVNGQQLNPYNLLRLVWEFDIVEWYEECILDILHNPFLELTTLDVCEMEPKITAIILTARMKCHRHRLELIPYLPGVIHDPRCQDHASCARDWKTAYSGAMLFFTQTLKFISGRDVFRKLSSVQIPSLGTECRRLTLDEINSTGTLWKEEYFIEEAVVAIKSVLRTERPSSPRPEPRFLSTNDN